jgi:hypothetical protein
MAVDLHLERGGFVYWGTIQIGSFNEDFIAYLCDWTPEQYRRQWLEAANRLVKGESKSAFAVLSTARFALRRRGTVRVRVG